MRKGVSVTFIAVIVVAVTFAFASEESPTVDVSSTEVLETNRVVDHATFELPCETRAMACDQQALYVLDQCGTIIRIDPVTSEQKLVCRLPEIGSALDLAVNDSYFAVIGNGRREIHLLSRECKLVTTFTNEASARAIDIALWHDTIAVAQFYDEHLVHLYATDGTLQRLLISNPLYREGYSPRFPSFISLKATPEDLYLFDQFDFQLHIIEKSRITTTVQKVQHPQRIDYRLPEQTLVHGDDRNIRYQVSFFALSADVTGDRLMALMINRDGSIGTEIVHSPLLSEQWTGAISLAGTHASSGAAICSIDDAVFILDRKANHVLSIKLE